MGSGRFSGYSCVKFVFFIFNVMFWLLGCAILGIGIWLHISKGNYASIAPSFNFLSATALCIAAGAIVLVVGFFGCCGAIMENPCMLLTYFSLMAVIFIMEIVGVALSGIYRKKIERGLRIELKMGIQEHYNKTGQEGLTDFWDTVQTKHTCCGVDGATDWLTVDFGIPSSCINQTSGYPFKDGCWNTIQDWVKRNLAPIIVISVLIILLQILGLLFSIGLYCSVKIMSRMDYDSVPQSGGIEAQDTDPL